MLAVQIFCATFSATWPTALTGTWNYSFKYKFLQTRVCIEEQRCVVNLFIELDYELSAKATIVAGLNYNQTAYDLKDRFPSSINNPDQSGSFDFNGVISPKIGTAKVIPNFKFWVTRK